MTTELGTPPPAPVLSVSLRVEGEDFDLAMVLPAKAAGRVPFPNLLGALSSAGLFGASYDLAKVTELERFEAGVVKRAALAEEKHAFYLEVEKRFTDMANTIQRMKRDYYREIDHLREQLSRKARDPAFEQDDVVFFGAGAYALPSWDEIAQQLDDLRVNRELLKELDGERIRMVPIHMLCSRCRGRFKTQEDQEATLHDNRCDRETQTVPCNTAVGSCGPGLLAPPPLAGSPLPPMSAGAQANCWGSSGPSAAAAEDLSDVGVDKRCRKAAADLLGHGQPKGGAAGVTPTPPPPPPQGLASVAGGGDKDVYVAFSDSSVLDAFSGGDCRTGDSGTSCGRRDGCDANQDHCSDDDSLRKASGHENQLAVESETPVRPRKQTKRNADQRRSSRKACASSVVDSNESDASANGSCDFFAVSGGYEAGVRTGGREIHERQAAGGEGQDLEDRALRMASALERVLSSRASNHRVLRRLRKQTMTRKERAARRIERQLHAAQKHMARLAFGRMKASMDIVVGQQAECTAARHDVAPVGSGALGTFSSGTAVARHNSPGPRPGTWGCLGELPLARTSSKLLPEVKAGQGLARGMQTFASLDDPLPRPQDLPSVTGRPVTVDQHVSRSSLHAGSRCGSGPALAAAQSQPPLRTTGGSADSRRAVHREPQVFVPVKVREVELGAGTATHRGSTLLQSGAVAAPVARGSGQGMSLSASAGALVLPQINRNSRPEGSSHRSVSASRTVAVPLAGAELLECGGSRSLRGPSSNSSRRG